MPKNVALEALAKSLFFKNWNTLEGLANSTDIIAHVRPEKYYAIEIECSATKKEIQAEIADAFTKAQVNPAVEDFRMNGNRFYFVIDLLKSDKNVLLAIVFLQQNLKNYSLKSFNLLRVIFEKENLSI